MITTITPPDKLYKEFKEELSKENISMNEFVTRCMLLYKKDKEFKKKVEKDIWEYGKELDDYKNDRK